MNFFFYDLFAKSLIENRVFLFLSVNRKSNREKFSIALILLMIALQLISSLASATEDSLRENLIVDVEQGSNLSLRSKTDLNEVINSLSKNEPVIVLNPKVKRFKDTDYILVRKALLPKLRCVLIADDDEMHDPDSYVVVKSDNELEKYKKENSPKSCPLIKRWSHEKDKYVRERILLTKPSQEKSSELEGFAAVKHLKGFPVPSTFTDKHREALRANGYRLIEPLDFLYYKDLNSDLPKDKLPFITYFNRGRYFLHKYADDFKERKSIEINKDHDDTKSFNYSPINQLENGFVLHLVDIDKKDTSIFAFLNSELKLHILSKTDSNEGIDEFYHLIPKNHLLVYDKELVGLNEPLPFYGLDPYYGIIEEFVPYDINNFLKLKKLNFDAKKLKEVFRNYQRSSKHIDFAIVIYDRFYFGDLGVNPGPRDSTMQDTEIIVKLKKSDDLIKSGMISIFD